MTNSKNLTNESNLSSPKNNDQKQDQSLKLLSTQLHDQVFLVELKSKDVISKTCIQLEIEKYLLKILILKYQLQNQIKLTQFLPYFNI